MSKPFDATTKELLDGYPGPWLAYLGLEPDGPIQVVDTALSTVTAAADKVYRIDGPEPYLVHLELQAEGDRAQPRVGRRGSRVRCWLAWCVGVVCAVQCGTIAGRGGDGACGLSDAPVVQATRRARWGVRSCSGQRTRE